MIESIIQERKNGGEFSNLKDFIERLSGKEVNKRTIESLSNPEHLTVWVVQESSLW